MAQQIRRSSSTGVRRASKAQSRAVTARKAQGACQRLHRLADGPVSFHRGTVEPHLARHHHRRHGGAGLHYRQPRRRAGDGRGAGGAGLPPMPGFEVRHVRVTGTSRMDERLVYARVLSQRERAMPEVDVAALRAEADDPALGQGCTGLDPVCRTRSAIDIVERTPHAVL